MKSQQQPFTAGELLLVVLFLTLPLAAALYMIPRAGLYAAVAALAWGIPAGGLIIAALRRGRVGQ